MTTADDLNRNQLPLARLLGVEIVVADPDRVVAALTVRADLCTAGEILHGGALMSLADTAGAIAASLNLRDGQRTTTLESKTNFLAGAPLGARVIAEALPLHRGRRTSVWQTRVTDGRGKLLAVVTQTQLVA